LAARGDIVLGVWGTSYFGNRRTCITGADTSVADTGSSEAGASGNRTLSGRSRHQHRWKNGV